VKKYLPCILLLIFASNLVAQIFSQNFNSSTNLTDYYNSTPSANQFRLISTTNSKSTVSVATNKLIFRNLWKIIEIFKNFLMNMVVKE
jgi:hypothetical protein